MFILTFLLEIISSSIHSINFQPFKVKFLLKFPRSERNHKYCNGKHYNWNTSTVERHSWIVLWQKHRFPQLSNHYNTEGFPQTIIILIACRYHIHKTIADAVFDVYFVSSGPQISIFGRSEELWDYFDHCNYQLMQLIMCIYQEEHRMVYSVDNIPCTL